jgi:hypothetical protein
MIESIESDTLNDQFALESLECESHVEHPVDVDSPQFWP